MTVSSPRWPMLSLVACLAAVWGCNPKIGDDCSTSTDCSVNGDRLCDTTQPGGYCTVFNCEPDTCPDEAQCIAFDTQVDPACDDQRWARFERTFCMRRCDNDGDCRVGYVCFDMNTKPNSWGAAVADSEPEGTKVCIARSSAPTSKSSLNEVCGPYDGEFPEPPSEASAQDSDAGQPDAEQPDAEQPDAEQTDAEQTDAEQPDAEQDAEDDVAQAGEDAS